MKHTYLLLVAVSFFMNCSDKNKSSNELIYVPLEDILQKEGTGHLSSVASEIFYIPLETNDNSLLRGIAPNIGYLNGNYVINDGDNIYLFDKDGKYIRQIAQKGGGPSDYLSIQNIVIDPATNCFYLYSYNKIIKFDEKANYITHISTDFNQIRGTIEFFMRGVFTPRKTMIMGLMNNVVQHDNAATVYNAVEIDTLGNIIKKFINHSPRYARQTSMQINSFNTSIYVSNNDVRFLDFGNDTIFSVMDDFMKPYAVLDLGNNKANLILDLKTMDANAMYEAQNNLSGHVIMKVLENGNYFFIGLTKKGMSNNIIYCLYDKKTKELKLLKDNALINDLDGSIPFFPQQVIKDNELISTISAEKFKEEVLSKDYNEQKAKYGERFEKVYQLAKSLKDDDNPVLIIAKE